MTVRYAVDEFGPSVVYRDNTVKRGPSPLHLLPGQNQEGYGSKIRMPYTVQFLGEKKRYPMYCVCWSNSGSLYIIRDKQKYFLPDFDQSDVVG